MFDPSIKAEGPLSAQPAIASKELPAFVAGVREAVAAAPPQALAANSVQVQPGGKTFGTITDALNSITDAKLQKQYVVYIGPGTYNEVVTCKPYVYLQGAGSDQTTITANAGPQQWDKGTVRGCSNSAVQNVSIVSTGQTWGDWATAVNCDGAQNFDVENCALTASGPAGTNLNCVAIDYSSAGGGSQVNVAYCQINANGGGQPIGLISFARGFVEITDSKIIAQNANTTWGAASNGGSTVNLYDCYVEGTMALAIPDYTSQMQARDCQLVGGVAPGVVIIND
jgi:hypothetical protein